MIQHLKDIGCDEGTISDVLAKDEEARAPPPPPRDSIREAQSLRDKIRHTGSAIAQLTEKVDEAQGLVDKYSDARDKLVKQRQEHEDRLSEMNKSIDADEPMTGISNSLQQKYEKLQAWSKALTEAMSSGADEKVVKQLFADQPKEDDGEDDNITNPDADEQGEGKSAGDRVIRADRVGKGRPAPY